MNRIKATLLLVLLTSTLSVIAQDVFIIPEPNQLQYEEGKYQWNRPLKVLCEAAEFENEQKELKTFCDSTALANEKSTTSNVGIIKLTKDLSIKNAEGYELEITPRSISLKAATAQGMFYAVQTLKQIIQSSLYQHSSALPCLRIKDQPRFSYRGLMLDPARHFLPIEDLKKYVEVMAGYKYNKLHLHLTDDQGWRLEIKKYPKLTTIGSRRDGMNGDKTPRNGFYTQEEMKDFVQFAAERHVEVIPEFDLPGHSVAAIASYPELKLSCADTVTKVRNHEGVSKDILCVGNDTVFTFIDDVIKEMSSIFPSKMFHIGGDEAPLDAWKNCAPCQALKKEHHLTTDQELFAYFFKRVNQSLTKYQKEPLFWYELDVPEYLENSTIFLWRMGSAAKVLAAAKKNNYEVICSPGEYAYFDYPQWKDGLPNVDWMGVITLQKVYQFDPAYTFNKKQQKKYIRGVEAPVWGESVKDLFRAFYMTYPRALALAEVGWTEMPQRNWDTFKSKLDMQFNTLLHKGVNYRPPVELYGGL
ncbi:beta-N-acetylhexosaminidase [Echinicola soli]|uniref:beta-N-acetylhexosaminidase n=1 Tax=Echinicola soli TaxID=2591634 RepID=A0A514CFE5_9BACT|nr:beta-N-acetylhexosaminidase [Echinicola soli]QDH78557.1 beta-N-acetylhexosaminidase [Echinicola soli]